MNARKLQDFAVALSDALIPGDAAFPSASVAGAVEKFSKRLTELRGEQHLGSIQTMVSPDIPFDRLTEAQRVTALTQFEQDEHAVFEEMLAVLYLGYYESPLVTAAIQNMGLMYLNPPQPHGYTMSGFNSADPLEQPQHARGHYVATDQVRRVSVKGLGHLAGAIDRP